MRRSIRILISAALAAAALPVLPGAPVPAATALPPGVVTTIVGDVSGLTTVRTLANGSVAVLQRNGVMRLVRNGTLLPTPALTLTVCSSANEQGLLGIAGDRTLGTVGSIYLYYTRPASGGCVNRVSRFTINNDIVDPGSEVVLVDNIAATGTNHNGGDLDIGKDDQLYIAIGDAGCDPRGNSGCAGANDAAQDLGLLNGKILRVDPLTGAASAGNPFSAGDECRTEGRTAIDRVCREIFAWGLRNPYRFAFDPNAGTTRFFINDVGQGTREEVNIGAIGANYGWPAREGRCPQGQNPPCAGPPPGITDPVTDYPRSVGGSITGGSVVPSGMWPSTYQGGYLFADYNSGGVWLRTAAGAVDYGAPVLDVPGITDLDFSVEAGGMALYTVTNPGGEITRHFLPRTVPTASAPLAFQSVPPGTRLLDTRRPADGGVPLTANVPRVLGAAAPANARAAVVNVTMVRPGANGNTVLWAAGADRPTASNVNAAAGQVAANLAIVPLDGAGLFQVATSVNSHVVIDLVGYFVDAAGPVAAGRLQSVVPDRLVDTRRAVAADNQYTETPRNDGGVPTNAVTIPVAGRLGIPPAGATAVVLTVTALSGSLPMSGFVTVVPAGAPRPTVSNLNVNGNGDVRANLVIVPLSAAGAIDVHLRDVQDVVVDVAGWFTGAGPSSTVGRFRLLDPFREVDTRIGLGARRFAGGDVRVVDPLAVPSNAGALAHNITIVDNAARGYVTAYGSDPRPGTSNGNAPVPRQNRAVASFTPMSSGQVRYFMLMPSDLVVDVAGYFEGS